MPSNLASVLDAARVGAFIGRQPELAAFESALCGRGSVRVLFAHGSGGIGKTTLLHQFRIRAERANRIVIGLDARDIDCSPESFRSAFEMGRLDRGNDRRSISTGESLVLLLDGYDRLTALDGWLRSEFLPSLPADSVVVIVGREPPAAPWLTDPGWRALARVSRLGPLDQQQSLDLLTRFAVPDHLRSRLTELGRGHPLTLALLADTAAVKGVPTDLVDAPDLVAALVERVVGDAPDETHALGLALCVAAWLTTEDLLRCAVGERAGEVWLWLETRPFITRGADGLYPHDLVREVLDADLRRRSPDRYRRVVRIVHEQAVAGLRGADSRHRDLWAHQKLHLHRRSPLSGSFWALRERGAAAVVHGRPEDYAEIIELVRHFDGTANARIAAGWLEAQPEGLSVVRSPAGVSGFVMHVIYPADPALVDADPVVKAAIEAATRISPARPGEQISIGRFYGGHKDHQRDAYAVLAACVSSTVLWLRRPLAWSLVATLDPDFWAPNFAYLGLNPMLQMEFDSRKYTIFGIDWRRIPVDSWLALMAERELTGEAGRIPGECLRPAPLSRADFDDAVRAALRELTRPDRLRSSALVGSRLIQGTSPDAAAALRNALLAGIAAVDDPQRSPSPSRVLDRTFVHAAHTQEAAAEVLDLPFSTYRRHLAKAIDELTDVLWAVEIGQLPALKT